MINYAAIPLWCVYLEKMRTPFPKGTPELDMSHQITVTEGHLV